jgi:hypothetical protein
MQRCQQICVHGQRIQCLQWFCALLVQVSAHTSLLLNLVLLRLGLHLSALLQKLDLVRFLHAQRE